MKIIIIYTHTHLRTHINNKKKYIIKIIVVNIVMKSLRSYKKKLHEIVEKSYGEGMFIVGLK